MSNHSSEHNKKSPDISIANEAENAVRVGSDAMPAPTAELLNWRQTFATGIWFGLICAAIVVHSMRQSGDIEQQISGFVAGFVALVANIISLTANRWFHASAPSSKRWAQFVAGIATLFPPAMLGRFLLPDDAPLGMLWLSGLFFVSAAIMFKIGRSADRRAIGPAEIPQPKIYEEPVEEEEVETSSNDEDASAMFDGVSQWMARKSLDDGADCIEGVIKVEIAADQKQTVVHLPFSPPFPSKPTVECEVESLENCRARITTAHPYGARIEIRCAGDCEKNTEVELQFLATCHAKGNERVA